jgi:arsenate reductase (thioredoxin)
MKILILCTGNSCRSQMAHGFLKSFDDKLVVASAGTEPALKVNQKAVQVMKELGIEISQHKPTLVDVYLNEEWDYVVTVCDHANETCPVFSGKVKKRLHIGFEDPSNAIGSQEHVHSEYIRIRDMIREAFYSLYQKEIKPSLI